MKNRRGIQQAIFVIEKEILELVQFRGHSEMRTDRELETLKDKLKQAQVELKKSKEMYEDLYENTPDMYASVDPKTAVIIRCNQTLAKNLGYIKEKIIGRPVFDIYHPDCMKSVKKAFQLFTKTGEVQDVELQLKRKDGSKIHVSLRASAVRDGQGNIIISRSALRDITELKKAEEALRQNTQDLEERVKELTCLYGVSGLLVDPREPLEEVFNQVLVFVPPAWQYPEITCAGITFEGKTFTTDNFQETSWRQSADIKVSGKAVGTVEVYYREEKPEIFEGPFLKEERDLIEALARGLAEFIVRKQSEKALQRQKNWLEVTLSSIGDAVIATDTDAKITFVNSMTEKLTGWTTQEALGQQLSEVFRIINEQTRQIVDNPVDRVLKEGRIVGLANHTVLIARDGKEIPIDDSAAPILTGDGTKIGAVLIFRDITDRKQAEEKLEKYSKRLEEMVDQRTKKLQDTQNELEIILDNVPGLIFYKDTENKFIHVNKVIADAHNMTKEEMKDKNLFDLYPNDKAQAYWDDDLKVINSGKPKLNFEEPWDTPEGRKWVNSSKIPFKDDTGNIIGIIGFSTDITERKKFEQQLIRNEKLAVLGQLAGGVGHELRNPLGAIKNAAFFLNMALEEAESEVKESLNIIEEEVITSERIISSLLDFARPKPLHVRKIVINEVIQKAQAHISVSEKIKVITSLDKRIPVILVDPDQLVQVFINIMSNAIQAMPKGGQLVIKSEIERSKWVVISFTDTGEGISKENLEKLFEPLFTTRAKGIGLGLAVSKTLVDGHGGKIEVDSKVGKGTTFKVILPMNGHEEEVE